jgi:serine/threonine protein kinase
MQAVELVAGADAGLVWQEVAALRQCQHPRVVQLLGVAVQQDLVLVATEYMAGGSLDSAMNDPHLVQELRWHARQVWGCWRR